MHFLFKNLRRLSAMLKFHTALSNQSMGLKREENKRWSQNAPIQINRTILEDFAAIAILLNIT
jgi:hypothetical protein